jgi:lysophospholipase L1-like esterase
MTVLIANNKIMRDQYMKEPIKILLLGDSITEGSPDFAGGYRGVLACLLKAADIRAEFVGSKSVNSDGLASPWHEGHPGFSLQHLIQGHTSEYSRSRPLVETLQRFRPDLILLLAGTNNLYFDAPQDVLGLMQTLLDQAFDTLPQTGLLLGTLLAIRPGEKPWGAVIPEDVVSRVADFNRQLSDLVDRFRNQGRSIALVDTASCVKSFDELLPDGVHPRPIVYERMATQWLEGIHAWWDHLGRR